LDYSPSQLPFPTKNIQLQLIGLLTRLLPFPAKNIQLQLIGLLTITITLSY